MVLCIAMNQIISIMCLTEPCALPVWAHCPRWPLIDWSWVFALWGGHIGYVSRAASQLALVSDHCNTAATESEERGGAGPVFTLSLPQNWWCSYACHCWFYPGGKSCGREENRVTGSHKWELDGYDVTGQRSNGTGSVWDLRWIKCLLGSPANIRVMSRNVKSERMILLYYVGRKNRLLKAICHKLNM